MRVSWIYYLDKQDPDPVRSRTSALAYESAFHQSDVLRYLPILKRACVRACIKLDLSLALFHEIVKSRRTQTLT